MRCIQVHPLKTIVAVMSYYTYYERSYFSLFDTIFVFHYTANYRKYELKLDFSLLFFEHRISGSMHGTGLIFSVYALMVLLEGSMSHFLFRPYFSFYVKKRVTFCIVMQYKFLYFI